MELFHTTDSCVVSVIFNPGKDVFLLLVAGLPSSLEKTPKLVFQSKVKHYFEFLILISYKFMFM